MANKPHHNEPLYGHYKRSVKRKEKHHKASRLATRICQESWQAFLLDNKDGVITDEKITQLYDDILDKITNSFSSGDMANAVMQRYKFFKKINDARKKSQLEPIILPSIAYEPKRPANTNHLDSFLYLKKAQAIVQNARNNWQTEHEICLTDALAWLIFSLMAYGGCNDDKVIYAFYDAYIKGRSIYQLPNHVCVMCVDIVNDRYGRRTADDKVCYSRWVGVDDVSLLWLNYINRQFGKISSYPSFGQVVSRLGDFVQEKIDKDGLARSNFYRHINLFWQLLPNSKIDQQMVAVLTGKQRHTAIDESALLNYFAPVHLSKAVLDDDFYFKTTLLASTQPTHKQQPVFKDDMVNHLRRLLKQKRVIDISSSLSTLLATPLADNHKVLVLWVQMLLDDKNKPATAQRYLSEIAQVFLSLTHDAHFVDWGQEDYEDLYDDMVGSKNPNKIGFTWTVIKSLHRCLMRYYDAPAMMLCHQSDALIVSDCLISPTLYQALINSIQSQKSLGNHHKTMLTIILSLLYRTGMRIGELLGIRVDDVECPNNNERYCAIIVRPNRHRDLKSYDGARRLVLSALLKHDECKAFVAFWQHKKFQKSAYLFTPEHRAEPLNARMVHYVLNTFLKEQYPHITPHSFRHHAISMLALIVGVNDEAWVSQWSDYHANEIRQIRIHLLGKQHAVSTNHWQSLKGFAGHASLETTFGSYIHTADLIAIGQMQRSDITLPITLVSKFTGQKSGSFNTYAKGVADFAQGVVHLGKIRPLLIKKLKAHTLKADFNNPLPALDNVEAVQVEAVQNSQPTNPQQKTAVKRLFDYPYYHVDKLLNDLEQGAELIDASHANFVFDDALFMYQRACALANPINPKLKHKLIGTQRKPKSAHPLIAPTPLHYHQERALVSLCFDNIKKHCQTERGIQEMKRFVGLFYNKVSSNKSQIRFSFKHKDECLFYLKIATVILPSKYWRINICQLTPKQAGNENTCSECNHDATQKPTKRLLKELKNFEGQITHKADYNGYAVSVIRPNAKGKPAPDEPASAIMKYVCHLLLVYGFGWDAS